MTVESPRLDVVVTCRRLVGRAANVCRLQVMVMLNMVLAIIMDVYAEAARCLFQKVLQCISHYS